MRKLMIVVISVLCRLSMSADVIVPDTVAWTVDTVSVEQVLREVRLVSGVEQTTDSTVDREHWFKALKRGKVDFKDENIYYPSLIRFGYNAVQTFNRVMNSYDSTYVVGTGKKIKLTLKNDNWSDDYDLRLDEDLKVEMKCKLTSNIGASISILGLSVGYYLSFDKLRGRAGQGSKFEISYSGSRVYAEFYRTHNTGEMTMTFIQGKSEKYPLNHFSGLRRTSWGVNALYMFNNRKYSRSAAYGYSKYQLRSAGSLMTGFGVSHRNFSTHYSDLPQWLLDVWSEEEDIDLNTKETLFDYTDVSLNVGYGYNWVINRHWLFNVTAMLYSGLKFSHSKSTSDGGRTFWAVNGKVNMAAVYDLKTFFVGLQGYIDSHFYNTGDYRFRSNIFDFSVNVGVRF